MWAELFRQLLLLFINIKAVLAGQQTLQQAIDGLVREITGLDVVANLAAIKADTADILTIVGSPDFGNARLGTKLDLLTTYDTHTILEILEAIAALPAGSSLPALGDITGGVWGVEDPYSDDPHLPYGQELANAHRWATFMIKGGSVPAKFSPFFNVSYPPPAPDSIPTNYTWPQPDWGDIRRTDALVIWLERTCPDFTWTYDASGENIRGYLTSLYEAEAPHYTPRMTGSEWYRLLVAPLGTAPIWPGVDRVTYGTTIPCAESTVIEVPMDGIAILVTSYPATRARWGAAPYLSVYHTGRLAFITDDGAVEPFQYMGWTSAIFTPQTMTRAAGCVIYLEPNVEAAATPWDITT